MGKARNPFGKIAGGDTFVTKTDEVSDNILTLTKFKADDPGARFWLGPVEHNFGSSASAVATKLTDAAPCDLEVLMVFFTLTEAKAGGTGDDVTKLTKEATGTTAMTGSVTLDMSDTVYMNHVNSVVAAVGTGNANARVTAGSDIFIYTDAQASRTAGKYSVIALCQKI